MGKDVQSKSHGLPKSDIVSAAYKGATRVKTGARVTSPSAGRILLGAWTEGGEAVIETREADMGRPYDIQNSYYDWGDNLIGTGENQAASHNRLVNLSWYGPGGPNAAVYGLDQVVAGAYDAYIINQAARVRAYGRPILIRWGEEMTGSWYTGYSGNPTEFKAAWKRIRQIFANHDVTNVTWVWNPDASAPAGGKTWLDYWPGDDQVDWIALDGYARLGDFQQFSAVFGPALAALVPKGKPIMFGECGCDASGDKAAWMNGMLGYVSQHATEFNIQALCWYDRQGTTYDYRVDSDVAAYTAWKTIAGYQLFGGPNANPASPGTGGTTVVADTFGRVDGSLNGSTTEAGGKVWTSGAGLTIVGGIVKPNTSSTTLATVDSGVSDCTVSAKWVKTGASQGDGVCFRHTDNQNLWYFRNTTGQLAKIVANTGTTVATFSTSSADGDIIEVVMSGANFTIKRNGIVIGTWTDAFNQTATKHGIRSLGTGWGYDNFRVATP